MREPSRSLPLEEQLQLLNEHSRRAGVEPLFPSVSQARRQLDVWLANGTAMHQYVPPRWEGSELQYFRASEPSPRVPPDGEVGWL